MVGRACAGQPRPFKARGRNRLMRKPVNERKTEMASTALVHGSSVPRSPHKLLKGYLSAKRSISRLNEKAEETIEGVVRTTETLGATFIFSGIQGAYWDAKDKAGKPTYGVKIAGISLDLGVGIALQTAAILGLGGKYAGHLKNFGDGALASYVANMARGVGYRWSQERKANKPAATKGSLEDDIAAMLGA